MKKMNYNEALKRLEEIVALLEDEDTPIEKSLDLFKEGIELTNQCQKKLAEIEQEINVLKSVKKLSEEDA